MIFETISREDAKGIFDGFVELGEIPTDHYLKLNREYLYIRTSLLEIENSVIDKDGYSKDLLFAMKIYDFFNRIKGFNSTVASDYGFWRYICLKVVPDIIMRRHGFVPEYFYEKNVRIYIPTMWWYVHMSYQGNDSDTFKALEKLNTDYIMQIVERPGRGGFYLEVTREIMKAITSLPTAVVNKKVNNVNLFRRIMIQNTAKTENYNLTVEGKTKEYVESLFKACNVEIENYERP